MATEVKTDTEIFVHVDRTDGHPARFFTHCCCRCTRACSPEQVLEFARADGEQVAKASGFAIATYRLNRGEQVAVVVP